MIITNIFRSRRTAFRVLIALIVIGAIGAIGLAVYVGLQEPTTSQPNLHDLDESKPSTPFTCTPLELEPRLSTGERHLSDIAPSLVVPQ